MQYILSDEEFKALSARANAGDALVKRMPSVKELQKLCSLVADHVPVEKGWYKGKAWGCILTTKKSGYEWYCDDCPAQNACPYPNKNWSQ